MIAHLAVLPHRVQARGVERAEHPFVLVERAARQHAILGETAIDRAEHRRVSPVHIERRGPWRRADGRHDRDVALVFHRAGRRADAHAVEAVHRVGAGRRQDQPGAGLDLRAGVLGEFDVVADRDADASPGRVEDARIGTLRDAPALGLEARHGAFFLRRHATVGHEQRRAIDHVAIVAPHRQRTRKQPHAEAPRRVAHRRQDLGRRGNHGGEFAGLIRRIAAGQRRAQFDAGIFRQHQQVSLRASSFEPRFQRAGEGCDRCRPANAVLQQPQPQRRGHSGSFTQKPRPCGVSRSSPTSFQSKITAMSARRT